MKTALTLLIAAFSLSFAFDGSYPAYARLLGRHVCRGGVAYESLKKDRRLLDSAEHEWSSATQPQISALPVNAQIAYYINGYNLFTLELIAAHLPLEHGIRDLSDPWGRRLVPLFGDSVSLDHLENEILRKQFKEPRIHFALVCASKSCPVLSNRPYRGDSLDRQLNRAAKTFLTDTTRNTIDGQQMHLSRVFDWYGDDFKKAYPSFEAFIDSTLGLSGKRGVSFREYDWSLNKVKACE